MLALNKLRHSFEKTGWPPTFNEASPGFDYEDKTASGLTKCVIDYFKLSGHFAIRVISTATYNANIHEISSQQRAVILGVWAIVEDATIYVETRQEKDANSETQMQTIQALLTPDTFVYKAGDFEGFYDWFTTLKPILYKGNSTLPFGSTLND
ncbi:VRR-NUC domain-containing protein [Larkinella humicola]|uniref:VRR-NUC domain-containing protein n=2 Tax=Larkinella humicola TaxID=2607654 RepID=A0A5N1JCQ4_9BACT|nr:VRR-NUC domain-containing protein [Larkinella humicola]